MTRARGLKLFISAGTSGYNAERHDARARVETRTDRHREEERPKGMTRARGLKRLCLYDGSHRAERHDARARVETFLATAASSLRAERHDARARVETNPKRDPLQRLPKGMTRARGLKHIAPVSNGAQEIAERHDARARVETVEGTTSAVSVVSRKA